MEFIVSDELSTMQKRIFEIIIMNLDSEELRKITIDTEFININIDSISYLKATIALEGEFDFEFDDEKLLITEFPTIRTLVEYVEAKANSGS